MNAVPVALVECESGDWVVVYVDGEMDYEGHEVSTYAWMNMIRNYKNFSSIDSYTVSDEYMEQGLPNVFDDIDSWGFVE